MESMPAVEDGMSALSPRPMTGLGECRKSVYKSTMEHATCTLPCTFIADHGFTSKCRRGYDGKIGQWHAFISMPNPGNSLPPFFPLLSDSSLLESPVALSYIPRQTKKHHRQSQSLLLR